MESDTANKVLLGMVAVVAVAMIGGTIYADNRPIMTVEQRLNAEEYCTKHEMKAKPLGNLWNYGKVHGYGCAKENETGWNEIPKEVLNKKRN